MGLGPTQGPGSGKMAEKVWGCKLGLFEKWGVYGPGGPPGSGPGIRYRPIA